MKEIKDYPEVSPRTIWGFRQNHPELVIRDCKEYLGMNDEELEFMRTVLLARGINKWLKVRRDLIAYKKQIKHEIKKTYNERLTKEKGSKDYLVLKERLKVLNSVRGTLKGLCMTERYQVWPKNCSIGSSIRSMNTIKCSDVLSLESPIRMG